MAWYDPSWLNCKAMPALGGGANVTNYQLVDLKIYYDDFTKTGAGEVDCEGLCQTDFDDIRIAGSDGVTLIPYDVQEKVDSDHMFVTTLVTVNATPATVLRYVYFNHSTIHGNIFPLKYGNLQSLMAQIYPAAVYYNGVHSRTFAGFGDVETDAYLTYYDHTTGLMAAIPVHVGHTATEDFHNCPAIYATKKNSGLIHCMYGCHTTPLLYKRSVGPEDIGLFANPTDTDWQQAHYYANGDDTTDIYGALWRGQTFQVDHPWRTYQLGLKLKKVGNPGNVTIEFYACDGNHKPTGAALSSHTFAGAGLPGASAWLNYVLGTRGNLTPVGEYCFYVKCPTGDAGNKVVAEIQSGSFGDYFLESPDSGSSWTTDDTNCLLEINRGNNWQTMASPAAQATYPRLYEHDEGAGNYGLYLIIRGPTNAYHYTWKKSANDGNTFPTSETFFDGTVGTYVIYIWQHQFSSHQPTPEIHLVFTGYDSDDPTPFEDVFYMYRDTGGTWRNAAGANLGAVPLTWADINPAARVYAINSTERLRPGMAIDSSNDPGIVFKDVNTNVYKFRRYRGAWVGCDIVTNAAMQTIEVEWVSGAGDTAVFDAYLTINAPRREIWKYRITCNAVGPDFASADAGEMLLEDSVLYIDTPHIVVDNHSDIKFVCQGREYAPATTIGYPINLFTTSALSFSSVLDFQDNFNRTGLSIFVTGGNQQGMWFSRFDAGAGGATYCDINGNQLRSGVTATGAGAYSRVVGHHKKNYSSNGFHFKIWLDQSNWPASPSTLCRVVAGVMKDDGEVIGDWQDVTTLSPKDGFYVYCTNTRRIICQVSKGGVLKVNSIVDNAGLIGDGFLDIYYDATDGTYDFDYTPDGGAKVDLINGTLAPADRPDVSDTHIFIGEFLYTIRGEYDNVQLSQWMSDPPTWGTSGPLLPGRSASGGLPAAAAVALLT